MQVVMNKCFLLNPEKTNLAQTMVSRSMKLTFNLLTVYNWSLE